jgi:hypothetical protein
MGSKNRNGRILVVYYYYFLWLCSPAWARASSFARFRDPTQRRATVDHSSQRPLPDNTQHTQQKNIHGLGGIQTHDRSRRAAVDLRLRSRGHWDRQYCSITVRKYEGVGHCKFKGSILCQNMALTVLGLV